MRGDFKGFLMAMLLFGMAAIAATQVLIAIGSNPIGGTLIFVIATYLVWNWLDQRRK